MEPLPRAAFPGRMTWKMRLFHNVEVYETPVVKSSSRGIRGIALPSFCMGRIFDYGMALQQELDETL